MSPLLILTSLVSVLLGMCIGAAINHDSGHPFQVRAQRAEAALQQYLTEQAARDTHSQLLARQAQQQPAPATVVHVHLQTPTAYQPQPQLPVIDSEVFAAPWDHPALTLEGNGWQS